MSTNDSSSGGNDSTSSSSSTSGTTSSSSQYLGESSWTGRTDTNKRVVFPAQSQTDGSGAFPALTGLSRQEAELFAQLSFGTGSRSETGSGSGGHSDSKTTRVAASEVDLSTAALAVASLVRSVAASRPQLHYDDWQVEGEVDKGRYVVVKVVSGRGHTLRAVPVAVLPNLAAAAVLDLPSLPLPPR